MGQDAGGSGFDPEPPVSSRPRSLWDPGLGFGGTDRAECGYKATVPGNDHGWAPEGRSAQQRGRGMRGRGGWAGRRGWAGAVVLGVALALSGCGEADPGAERDEVERRAVPAETEGFQLVPSPDRGSEVADARLGFAAPEEGERFAVGEPVEVRFRLSGYELRVSTPGGDDRGIARAADGQHIHLILNDQPYRAVYDAEEPQILDDLPEGTHVLRAFPGLDWHEAVKGPGAFARRVIHVGDGTVAPPAELDGPLLTYSRPVGEYEGPAADSILVDFHLSGVRLSPEGYRVRLTVDGMDSVLITDWSPYLLVGLPDGEHAIRLELLDPDGAAVPGAFNRAERTIQVRRSGE